MALCICGSKKDAAQCCEPLLRGKEKAKTVRQLVRARYAAYALGGHGDFLKETWHPATRRNIGIADLNGSDYDWQSLEIVRYLQKGDRGQVEFKASFKEGDAPAKTHHEISLFQREKGNWYYLDGKVLP
jgi:SEC-C motif-containing protein